MARYEPEHVEALTNFLNALTRSAMTQNDTFRLLESLREQYGLPDPIEAFLDGLVAEDDQPIDLIYAGWGLTTHLPEAEPESTPLPEGVTVYPMVAPSSFRWRPDGVPVYPAIPTYGLPLTLEEAEDCMASTGTAAPTRPLTPDEALTRLHTMRPADPVFTRTYLSDAG